MQRQLEPDEICLWLRTLQVGSYVGYVHAVAHSLGGAYNIPHGLANSVLLPVVLKRYGPKVYKKLKQLAVAAGLADKNN